MVYTKWVGYKQILSGQKTKEVREKEIDMVILLNHEIFIHDYI